MNTSAIWLQIGNATGDGTAQDIRTGDTITVHEVDKVYLGDGNAESMCACLPEKYAVWAYVTKTDTTTRKRLTATTYRASNNCGTVDGMLGCGTSDFTVP